MSKTSTHLVSYRLLSLLLVVLFATPLTWAQDAASLTIEPVKFVLAEGKVGQTTLMGQLRIKAVNMPSATTVEVRGTNRDQFSLTATTVAAGTHDVTIDVNYVPTKTGKHKGTIIVDCPEVPSLSATYALEGIAIDPQNPPVVTCNPAQPAVFTAKEKQTMEQTIEIGISNAADNTFIRLKKADNTFILSTGMISKWAATKVKVTFKPLQIGTYADTIVVAAYGADTVLIPLKGVCEGSADQEAKEGDELNYTGAAPVTTFSEYFENVTSNKPLKIDGWQNVANMGTRAWWGYVTPASDKTPNERVAKVTPYDRTVIEGQDADCAMLLVTPAIDFKNSTSKMFTFRVRGQYLRDGQDDELGLYYMCLDNGKLQSAQLGGIDMPDTEDENDDWREIHIDLSHVELPDVFSLYFGFKSKRGPNHAATYFLDDITYGRTDIPAIRPAVSGVAFLAYPGQETRSEEINVNTQDLKEPVTLSVGGANKGKYTLSTTTLPVGGGQFFVTFKSDQQGVHEAYVKLASRGAADVYIALSTNNTTGIDDIRTNVAAQTVSVYSLGGQLLGTYKGMTLSAIKSTLAAGTYVFKTAGGTQTIVVR